MLDIVPKLPETIIIEGDAETREVYLNGDYLSPKKSQKIRNHSPDGFNWGYGGSGPAQLSFAILLNLLPEEIAVQLYQAFKFKVIGALPQGKDFAKQIKFREIISEIILKTNQKVY